MTNDAGFVQVDYPVLQLAAESHTEYLGLTAEHSQSSERDSYVGDDFSLGLGRRRRAAAVKAVVFAAGYLDYFIYRFACTYDTIDYFERNLDKLSAVGKWIVIPRLFVGKELNQETESFQFLKRLVQARNRIVHPRHYPIGESTKGFQKTGNDIDEFFYCAANSIPGMLLILRDIQNLDSKGKLNVYTEAVIEYCVGQTDRNEGDPSNTTVFVARAPNPSM